MEVIGDFLSTTDEAGQVWTTGLPRLDELTGGFRRGQVWVLTGHPRAGRSTLLTKLAFTLAVQHGFHTDLCLSRRDPAALVRARLISHAIGRRISPDAEFNVTTEFALDHEREGLRKLLNASLRINRTGGYPLPSLDDSWARRRVVAIDDAAGQRPQDLAWVVRNHLRTCANNGALVLLTVQRSHCIAKIEDGDRRPEVLREEWSSVADVMLEVVQDRTNSPRSIQVLANRYGGIGRIPLDTDYSGYLMSEKQ